MRKLISFFRQQTGRKFSHAAPVGRPGTPELIVLLTDLNHHFQVMADGSAAAPRAEELRDALARVDRSGSYRRLYAGLCARCLSSSVRLQTEGGDARAQERKKEKESKEKGGAACGQWRPLTDPNPHQQNPCSAGTGTGC